MWGATSRDKDGMLVLRCHVRVKWRGVGSVLYKSVLNVMKYVSIDTTSLPVAFLSAHLIQLFKLVFNLRFCCSCGEQKSFSVRKSMVFQGITGEQCSNKCLTNLPKFEHLVTMITFKENCRELI